VRRRTLVVALVVGGAVVFIGGAGVAGACKLALDCSFAGSPPTWQESLEPKPGEISLPPSFAAETVASGFQLPTSFAFLPDGRILVAEKAGLVKTLEDGRVRRRPALDLRNRVNARLFRGVVAVAGHAAGYAMRASTP
jgi:glucose/arabinose dehydrogenase